MQKTIFVVDDNSTNLSVAEEALENLYQVITLSSASKMFAIMEKITPNLILLDIEMPEMTGFQAMKQLKASSSHSEIPVIFLTSLSDSVNEAYGIELGAVDFITKPFSVPVLLNRIKNHLDIDELIRERTEQLRERTERLERLQNGIVCTMADLVENRDTNTGGHIDRTTVFMKLLIDAMNACGIYRDEMEGWDLESVISSARLHDIGKISIPDAILNKPDKLTNEEFQTMKSHSALGEQIIDQMVSRTGEVDFLSSAKLSAAYHHERWDGKGYPYGVKETDIPLHGRIMAIVDVYDALTSDRPYKKAFSNDEAVSIIMDGSGKHFDPRITEVFFEIKNQFEVARVKLSRQSSHVK
ncbi:MAG: response regulator [Treponema sp.]|nr:response regulator [Treponema sp.]